MYKSVLVGWSVKPARYDGFHCRAALFSGSGRALLCLHEHV